MRPTELMKSHYVLVISLRATPGGLPPPGVRKRYIEVTHAEVM